MVTRTPALSSFPAVRGFGRGLVRFGRRKPLGGFSLVFLCIVGLVAIFPSLLTTQDPLSPDFVNNKQPPGSDFLLGSDYLGRDVFSRVIYGTRTSLTIGFAAVFFGTTLGGMWGLVSGVVGGKFDIISQRLLEVIMAFPALVLAILLVGSIGAGLMTVIIAIAATRLPFGVRVVRSVSLAVREYMYVDAARAIGASETRVILRHVLPNCVAAYIILATAHYNGSHSRLPWSRSAATNAQLGQYLRGCYRRFNKPSVVAGTVPRIGHHNHRTGVQPVGGRGEGLPGP